MATALERNYTMSIKNNRMVSLNQNSITGQTFHWHDEVELLMVVEGSLCLKVGYEELLLNEGDIMLINSDEIHRLKETSGKNVVVCTYIDCNVIYEKYPDFYEIVAISPYSDAFKKLNQEKHTILRQINNIAVALEDGASNEKITTILDALLRSLIYCYRLNITDPEGACFQVPDEKKDFIYRTIKYLYSNYNNNANLQDVSEQEYLSMFYLSHSFKNLTGYNFRDWLNFVRVEKGEKMLLVTTTAITEIAFQCGFSDVRYFNKHFTKWYGISPSKYRKLFQDSYDLHENIKSFEDNVSMRDIINKIKIVTPERTDEAIKEKAYTFDLESTPVLEELNPSWREELWCSGFDLINYRRMRQIEKLQQHIHFSAITVDELFSIVECSTDNTATASNIQVILYDLLDKFEKVYLVINLIKDEQYEIDTAEHVLYSLFRKYPKIKREKIELRLNLINDDPKTLGRISSFTEKLDKLNIYYKRYYQYKKPMNKWGEYEMDYLMNMVEGDLRLDWLFSKDGFKNNLYYFYFFLSEMGKAIIAKEESFVITRKEDNFQIFFHNKGARSKDLGEIKYQFTFQNLTGIGYKLITYTWDMERNDYSSFIKNRNIIKFLNDNEHTVVDDASLPKVSMNYIDQSEFINNKYELEMTLLSTSMYLILLTKVDIQ